MELSHPKTRRYRNVTEKCKSLLFLLREVPYITMADIRRFYYPGNHFRSYSVEMTGVLTKNRLITRYMLSDGTCIHFLTDHGKNIVDFYLGESPKYHAATESFYYLKPPRNPSEVNPFFFFPAKTLEFHSFTPYYLGGNPYHHTRDLLELFVLLKNAYRFLYVLWLDKVKNKKEALNVSVNPDLLLTNDYACERRRIFIEFENSRIREERLVGKLNSLTTLPADFYFFLCSSEAIFQNLGRLVRKILLGEAKVHGHTLFFSVRSLAALSRNVCIGVWIPSSQTGGVIQKLSEVRLYRYDDEIFDKKMFVNESKDGVPLKDPDGKILKKEATIPYSARKQGTRRWKMGDILNLYTEDFSQALDKVLFKNSVSEKGRGEKAA